LYLHKGSARITAVLKNGKELRPRFYLRAISLEKSRWQEYAPKAEINLANFFDTVCGLDKLRASARSGLSIHFDLPMEEANGR
jgi:hypothetical protein